jgi:hypothetical protein
MAKKKAHLKLTAAQHRHLMKALKGGALGDVHDLDDLKLFVEPGDFGGEGFFSDLGSEVKSVAKKAQQNPLVRAAEKKAVKYGATALRGATEGLVDGVGDTAATFLGVPELAVPLDAAVDRGLSSLQRAGTKYVDDRIDASGKGKKHASFGEFASAVGKLGLHELNKYKDPAGKGHGVRYMAPSGGGMRMAGVETHSGGALRLAGQGHSKAHHCGCGIRLAGRGITAGHSFPSYPLEHGATA